MTDAYRFVGNAQIAPTQHAEAFTEDLVEKIIDVLKEVNTKTNLSEAIISGALGNQEDGAYPGKFGAKSVRIIKN